MSQRSSPVMLLGVSSCVGKSHVGIGLCRLARQMGKRVGFFKSLVVGEEVVVAGDGGYVAAQMADYAQVAGGVLSHASNPCFYDLTTRELKVLGESCGRYESVSRDNIDLSPLPHARLERIRAIVLAKLALLHARHDFVLVEGGGSCTDESEQDFTNGFIAARGECRVVIVASGENGGFASALIGTYELMPAALRRRVCGFICNRVVEHRPQVQRSLGAIRERTGLECLGCLPVIESARQLSVPEWAEISAHLLGNAAIARLVAESGEERLAC